MGLIFGELLKHRKLVAFLKAAQADAHCPRLRGYDYNRRMGPKCCGYGGDAIADARSVLAYADTLPATHPGKTVRHMCCPLFMHHRYESDPCRLENVHGIQERGSHDSENIRNSMGMHRFDKRLTWRHARHILSSTWGVEIKHIRPVDLGIGPQLLIEWFQLQ